MRIVHAVASALVLAACSSPPSPADGDVSTDATDAALDITGEVAPDAIDAFDAFTADVVTDTAFADANDASPDAPTAAPFTAPDRTWTWIDIDGAVCDDGSPTGVGVNLVPDAPGTLVLLAGGGACWDAQTCLVLNTSVHGPFGSAQFASVGMASAGTLLDRSLAGNPFADWNMVFVPPCTGDAHMGDHDASYTNAGTTTLFHHRGRANVAAFLPRLAATVPASHSIAWFGTSIGGFGALANHDLVRANFPSARVTVLDDSGPLFAGDTIPAAMRDAWYANWALGYLDASCPGCRTDLSQLEIALATRFPGDRIGLLSSLQDQVMRTYFMLGASAYETALRGLATSLTSRSARAVFATSGQGHVVAAMPTTVTAADGAPLLPWITDAVNGGASWTSHGP